MRKVVLAHGVWDLCHLGHMEHLAEAKSYGDYLVVSVVADRFVAKPRRPMICTQAERMAALAHLRSVDDAILCDAPGPQELIEKLRPDLYVRGPDYAGKRMPESEVLERLGIAVFTTRAPSDSTTALVGRIYALCKAHPEFA